jgi:TP901 family phage tail tape measure protein
MVSEKLGAAFVEVGADLGPLEKGLSSAQGMMQHAGTNMAGGLKSSLQGGNFSDVGKQLGNQLVGGMTSQFGALGQAAGTFATALGPAGIALLGIGASIAVIGVGLGKCVSSAATWQTLMVDVQKVTDTTEAGFASLSKDLLAIRGETGASMESIAGAAAGAGRMGIDPTEIADYTSTILKMSSAWGMSADAASESIGKIGSVVKPAEMSWTEFGNRMGSTINDLADSMATSEESIVTGMKKVSAQMAMLKPDPSQLSEWAALIGQLQAFGMTAETSGESLKDSLNYMMRDDKGGISSMLDMDSTEFQTAIREDAIGTIQELAVAISELPIEEQGQALQKFGATGGQMMGMLVGKVDPVTKEVEGLNAALATGAGAWENASSLNDAYVKSQETLNSQIDIFKGKLSVAATSIGTVLLPVLTSLMESVNAVTQSLIDLGTKGWHWLAGDEATGAEGSIDKTMGGLVGWMEGVRGSDMGLKIWGPLGEEAGEEFTEGVAEGTEGVGPAIEGNLENVDAEGAGEEAGEAWGKAFDDAIDAYVKSGMSREMAVMYSLGATSDTAALAAYNAYNSQSKGHTLTTYGEVKVGKVNPMTATYMLTDSGDWQLKLVDAQGKTIGTQSMSAVLAGTMSPEEIVSQLISDFLASSHRTAGPGANTLEQDLSDDEKLALGDLKVDLETVVELSGRVSAESEFEDVMGPIQDAINELEAQIRDAIDSADYGTKLDLSTMIEAGFTDMKTVMADIGQDAYDAFADGFTDKAEVKGLLDKLWEARRTDKAAFEALGGQDLLDNLSKIYKLLIQLEDVQERIAGLEASGLSVPLELRVEEGDLQNQVNEGLLAAAPYIVPVEAAVKPLGVFDVPDLVTEMDKLGVYDRKLYAQTQLLDPLTDSLKGVMDNGVLPLSRTYAESAGIYDEHNDLVMSQIEAYEYLESAINTAQVTQGVFSAGLDKLLTNFDLETASTKEYAQVLKALGVELSDVGKATRDLKAEYEEESPLMSWFGYWQENTEGLFQEGYAGRGGTGEYAEYDTLRDMAQKSQKIEFAITAQGIDPESPEGKALLADYNETRTMAIALDIEIPPEQAWVEKLFGGENVIGEAAVGEAGLSNFFTYGVKADTSLADASIAGLTTAVEATKIAPVEADIAPALSELERLEAEIMEPVTKPIYLQQMNDLSGDFSVQAQAPGSDQWLSFAEGGIISSPTVAIVGDARTPEVAAPLGDLLPMIQRAVATAGGGVGVTVNAPITVYGGGDAREIAREVAEELKIEISDAYVGRLRGGH